MTDQTKPANPTAHGDYERRDISVAAVLYFLAGLLVAGLIVHFVVHGLFFFLQKQNEAHQVAVSPLVTNAPTDTRRLPKEYETDAESTDYQKYLKKNFPVPQLETNERNQLDKIRLNEEQILSTYDYIDQKAGTVRIPIDRAMDLIAQRGLPVRSQSDQLNDIQSIDCTDPRIRCITKPAQQTRTENAKEIKKK
jgi:hypothetical protein